jgi:hypothetical protein
MRKNPERVAWTVLSAAFITFCALIVGIPLSFRSYLLNATVPQDTQMQVIEGTVLVRKSNGGAPMGVTKAETLAPGDEVITDATSWATLDLFDRSHAILYSNTDVELEQMRSPRFGMSPHPDRIDLNLTGGLVRVGVALKDERPTEFRVITPHTVIRLEEGSYRIRVNNQGTEVTVDRGRAVVGKDTSRSAIPQGTRTLVDLSGVPSAPLPAAQNVIHNGDFLQPLNTAWLTSTEVLAPSVEPPTIEVVEDGGRMAVRLIRREQDEGNHTQAAIQQRLDYDVRDFVRLEVSLDVKLDFQSLSGGGQLSSEFPVIVRLDYKDRWGNDQFWTHGFYYQNQAGYPIALDPWGQLSGEQIPRAVWYPYESGNLLELLGESGPVHITGLTVYASGWNYDSLATEIQLIVE